MGFRVLSAAVAAAALMLMTAVVLPAAASASTAPVQMTFACALKSNGLMNYTSSLSKCTSNEIKVTVVPGPVQVCVHTNESVFLIPPATCTAPNMKLTLPSPSGPVFFCAANGSGVLNFTTTKQCTSKQFLVEVLAPAPVLANIETTTLQYFAGTPPAQITSSLTVSSAQTTTLAGATVRISSGLIPAEDSLGFSNQNGITGSYNASTGVLTLTGTASVANYQAALRSVTYSDSNALTPTATRTISFQVDDGLASSNLSNVASRTVNVKTNTPPTAGNVSASTDKNTATDINVLSSASDPDGDPLSVASVDTTGTKGTVSINGNGTVHYDPNGQFQNLLQGQTATDTFTYKVSDGFQTSSSATVTVTINGVNDPPVLANIETGALQYTAGTPAVPVTSTLTVSSPDTTTLAGATVKISSGLAPGEDSLGFTSQNGITGSYSAATGVLTLTGTASVADYQAALRSVTYSDSNGSTPSTGPRAISFQVDDGLAAGNLSNVASRAVNVNPNSPPVAGNVSASTDKNTATDINVLSSASDPDGDAVTLQSVDTTGTKGLVTINPNSTIHYDPNGQFQNLQQGQTAQDTFTYTVSDGFFTATGTVTVTINGVNDPPVISNVETTTLQYTAGTPAVPVSSSLTVSSAATATLAGATVKITSGLAPGEDSLGFTSQNGITGSYNAATGVLTLTGTASVADYQAALRSVTYSDSNGSTPSTGPRAISFQVDDGLASNNLSNVASRAVNVNPNSPPVAGNVSASTDKHTAIDINVLSSASDPDGDPVSVVSVDTTGTKGSVSINGNGTVHYDPNGQFQNLLQGQTATDTFGYTVSDGFFTATATVTVTITGLNDPPVLANIEGGTLQYFAGTPAVPVTSTLTVSSPDTTTLAGATVSISSGLAASEDSLGFVDQQGITGSYNSATGVLTLSGTSSVASYEAALRSVTYRDSNGASATTGPRTISFQVDDGVSGGNNLSNTVSRTVQVNPNSPPIAGPVSASTDKHTATDINVLSGASDPDGDAVTLTGVNTTGTKGSVTINPNSTVHYDPNGQFQNLTNGQTATDTFGYTVSDGFQTATGTVTVTINGVSDPPVISNIETSALSYRAQDPAVAITGTLTISDDDDATIASAQVSIVSGFSSGQDSLGFTSQNGITGSYNSATGVLTLSGNASIANYQTALQSVTFFTSDDSVNPASRVVSFSVTDSVDGTTAAPLPTRTINVAEANQPPVAVPHSYTAVGNTPLGVGTTPAGPAATQSGSLLDGTSDPDSGGPVSVTGNSAPGHGTVTVNPDGTFTYLPNAGFSGTDTFTYTITDSDDPLNLKTATATVTITVGPVVWYVDNSKTAAGNGEAGTPFNTLPPANSAAGANSIIFLYQGTAPYAGGVTMQSGEDLWGQPHGLAVDGFNLVAAGGSNPAITNSVGNGIALGEGSDVEAVNVSGPSGIGISSSGVNNATVGVSNAVAVSGAGGGIGVSTGNGTLSFGNVSVNTSAGHSVSVASRGGGTVSFGGSITDHGTGISLTGNAGTISFGGALTIGTGTSAGFTATGGGTVTANASGSTIATTTGTALNVSGTAIGAAGLKFQAISSSGANPGINLANTGSSGGLIVTGTGSAGSGGTIQGSVGEGINLSSTTAPSFTGMVIQNNGADGINGSLVNGLTLAASTVSGNGTVAGVSGENNDGLDFSPNGNGSPDGLTGTVTISNSMVTGSADNNAVISDSSGTLNLTVTGTTFSNDHTNDGVHVDANGTTNATVSITGSTFTNSIGDHFQFSTDSASSGSNNVTFSNNTLNTTVSGCPAVPPAAGCPVLGGGMVISPDGTSSNKITIDGNNIQNSVAGGIGIDDTDTAGTAGSISGTIAGNTVGTAAVAGSGSTQGSDIGINADGSSTETLAITNNTLFQYEDTSGINVINREGNPTQNLTITGNTIANPGALALWGLQIEAGATSGPPADGGKVCAAISGNSMTGSAPTNGISDFELRQRFNTTIQLPGYAGANNNNSAVVSFVQGNNVSGGTPTGTATNNVGSGGGGFVGGAGCPTPS